MKTQQDRLLNKHLGTIRVANVLSYVGILIGIACYWTGWLERNDWRGLGLGLGLTAFLPIAYVIIARARWGAVAIKECLVTYASDTPPWLHYGVLSLMVAAGTIAAVSLFRELN